MPTYQVVQQLLAARRDLTFPRALRALDAYDVMILDDLGYVQQTPDEAEVLFTLMAERYERRSLVIPSNLVFSEWGPHLQEPDDDRRRRRGPPRPPRHDPRDRSRQHPRRRSQAPKGHQADDNYRDNYPTRRQLPDRNPPRLINLATCKNSCR
jgi:hypothetical protein